MELEITPRSDGGVFQAIPTVTVGWFGAQRKSCRWNPNLLTQFPSSAKNLPSLFRPSILLSFLTPGLSRSSRHLLSFALIPSHFPFPRTMQVMRDLKVRTNAGMKRSTIESN
jgi:hypothetical protein